MTRPAWLRDPLASSVLLFGGVIVVGFVAIYLGYRITSRTAFVPSQVPALISGGLGGLALILLGAGLINIQVRRRLAAAERAEVESVLNELSAVVESARRDGA